MSDGPRAERVGVMRRIVNAVMGGRLQLRQGPSMDDFGPFASDGGWSIVTGMSPTNYERVGMTIRIQGFEQNAVVHSCIRVISETIGAVAIELYRESADGGKTPERENPGTEILNTPRVQWSAVRMRTLTAAYYVAYGNAYWVIEREGGKISGLRLVHPERILYVYLDRETLEPVQYDWTDRMGVRHHTRWEDMIHFKDLDLAPDAIFGFPRACSALLDISTDGEASQYVRQIIGNNGSPALIIGLKSITNEKTAADADARWKFKMTERGGRGGATFMPGIERVENIGFNLTELEFPSLRQITREDICAAFGVDPRMVGIASAKGAEAGMSGEQYAEARRRLYYQTCAPIMASITSELDLNYAPEFGDLRARFNPDEIADLIETEMETSTRIRAELASGLITREEGRRATKRPEAMKPTDTLIGSLGRVEYPVMLQFSGGGPGGSDPGDEPGAGGGGDGGDPNANPADPTPPGDGSDNDPDPSLADQAAGKRARSRFVKRGTVLSAAQRLVLWQAHDARGRSQEATYRRTAEVLFRAEANGVRKTFEYQTAERGAVLAVRAVSDDPFIAAALERIQRDYGKDGVYYRAWIERYLGLISSTFKVAGDDMAAAAGISFTMENPQVQAAIQARVRKLALYVTETTAKQITDVVSAGRSAGFGIKQIADLIDETVFGNTASMRAERIAQTETIGALNQGEFVTASSTGVLKGKEWLTQGDDRVRPSHQINGGMGVVAIGDRFPNALMYPGDQDGAADEVINCRCGLIYSD